MGQVTKTMSLYAYYSDVNKTWFISNCYYHDDADFTSKNPKVSPGNFQAVVSTQITVPA